MTKWGTYPVTDTTAKLTRRGLLELGGTAFALTLTGVGTASALTTLSPWRRASYLPLVGQSFSVRGYASPLTLTSVGDLQSGPAGSDNAFALMFRTPSGARPMPSSLGVLTHATLGTFSLMLVPGEAPGSARGYVAVINRVHA